MTLLVVTDSIERTPTLSLSPAFARKHWKLLAGSALLLAGSIGVVGTAASFTDTAAITADISTGSLDINVDGKDGTIALDLGATNLKPGDTKTKTFVLKNSGSLAASVTASSSSSKTLTDVMTAVLKNGSTQVYSGSLTGLSVSAIDLEPGASSTLSLSVTLPASVDNSYQSKTDKLTVSLSAVQAD